VICAKVARYAEREHHIDRLLHPLRRVGAKGAGVLIAESIWPNSAYADGCGINTLTGADPIAPYGGAAFHDNKVWVRRAT